MICAVSADPYLIVKEKNICEKSLISNRQTQSLKVSKKEQMMV